MIGSLEKLHSTLDELLETKKKSERIIFYALPFLALGFLSYQFITPISEKKIFEKKAKRAELKKEIKATEEYLARKPEILKEMQIISETNKVLNVRLQQQIAENTVLYDKVAALDFIYLDNKNIVSFLDNLAVIASKNKTTIAQMTTSIKDKNSSSVFKKEMHIDMNCSGDFKNLLTFANDVESARMFAKIESMKMSYGKTIGAEIQINVSGL
jgi:hypothetical protein